MKIIFISFIFAGFISCNHKEEAASFDNGVAKSFVETQKMAINNNQKSLLAPSKVSDL